MITPRHSHALCLSKHPRSGRLHLPPSPSYEYGCQGLAEFHAALHEHAVALGRVFQQRIEHLVGGIRMIMPPTTAHTEVEVIGDLIIQDAFELKPVALAARRIGPNREEGDIQRVLPNE